MPAPMIAYAALAGIQLLSGVQQANAIQRQAEIQRELDQFNIEQAQLDAFQAEADGYSQMARYQNVIDEIQAKQTVQYAAAKVDSSFGSAKDVITESNLNAELNLLDLQAQAHKKALGYQQEANARRGQSGLNMIGADLRSTTARNTAILGAANTMLTGYERNGGKFNWFDSGPKNVKSGVDTEYLNSLGMTEEEYNIAYGGGLGSYP